MTVRCTFCQYVADKLFYTATASLVITKDRYQLKNTTKSQQLNLPKFKHGFSLHHTKRTANSTSSCGPFSALQQLTFTTI